MFALFDTYESRGFIRGQEEGFSKGRKEGFNKGRKEGKSEGISLFAKIGDCIKKNPGITNDELVKMYDCTEDEINAVRAFLTR